MGKSKKPKNQKTPRNNTQSSAGPLLDKLWPKGLKGSLFWKSSSNNSHNDKTVKSDDQIGTGTQSSHGSAINLGSTISSGSTHNMLPPILSGARTLKSDSAKSVASSGYESMANSTRNSVAEPCLPPVPGHTNLYGSDSDIVHKSSPDTSPLAAKKWSVSSSRRSREESSSWMLRNGHGARHKASLSSSCSNTSPRPSQSSIYASFTPMTITPLANRRSRCQEHLAALHIPSLRKPHVVKVHDREYSFSSTFGQTSIEVREPPGTRIRKCSDLHPKKSVTNRASIASLPPLDERGQKEPTRPQRNSYNCKAYAEKETITAATSRMSISGQSLSGRPSITNDTNFRRSVHKISITAADDATSSVPLTTDGPVERPTSKRRYGTIMLESPRLSVIEKAMDYPTFEKPLRTVALASNSRRDSLVVPAVPQIIFISPTPDPGGHGAPSPSSTSTTPSEQQV